MGVYIWNKLPSEYQEVEYIGRNGNNYIDTGWMPTANFTVKIGYKIADSGYRYILLSQYGGGTSTHSVSLEINSGSVSNNSVRFYCGSSSATQFYSSNYLNLNSFNDITISSPGTINLNGTTTTSSSMYTGSYDNKTCRLFVERDLSFSTYSHNSFISYCKIYESGTLVRDFVPCYRKADNVIGLYDLVNNQFYTNSGTGTFTKGSDVNTYRESSLKNAYIGEVGEYSISNIPTTDTNVYVNVARSQKIIQSVTFSFTATMKNNSSSNTYTTISSNNSNTSRYGLYITSGYGSPLYPTGITVRGRLNGGSETNFRTIGDGFNNNGTNVFKYTINRDGNCVVVCNGTTTNYTATGAELNVIQTIMNLSNMNVYSAQSASGILTDNKVDVTVAYS